MSNAVLMNNAAILAETKGGPFKRFWFIEIATNKFITIDSQLRPWLDDSVYKYDGMEYIDEVDHGDDCEEVEG